MEVGPGYRLTEVGVIPENWELRKLLTTVRIANGQVDPRQDPFKSMILVAPDHIERGTGKLLEKRTAAEQGAISGKYAFKAGDIVYSKIRPYLKKAILADFDGLCSADMYPLKPAADVVGTFMLPLLLGHQFTRYAESVSVRSGMPKINRSEMADFVLALPPKREQQAIAEALSDVDALLIGLDRLLAKKRNLKQAAMQRLLTGQTRLPGFDCGWQERTLGQLFHFSGGYSASRELLSTKGHCYLHYGDIHKSSKSFVDVGAEYQDIPKLEISLTRVSRSSLLEDGDVVFVDASEDDEGTSKHVVVINKARVPFIAGLHTIVAKPKTKDLTHDYRRYCFQTSAVRRQFLYYAVGTKVSGISKTNIARLTLPVPPISEQNTIAEVLSDMDAEITALERRREKTRALKKAMMQELLTGKTRLI